MRYMRFLGSGQFYEGINLGLELRQRFLFIGKELYWKDGSMSY